MDRLHQPVAGEFRPAVVAVAHRAIRGAPGPVGSAWTNGRQRTRLRAACEADRGHGLSRGPQRLKAAVAARPTIALSRPGGGLIARLERRPAIYRASRGAAVE